jgi:hypothetical protein
LADSVRRGQKFFVVFNVVFVRDARNTCDNEIVMAIRLNSQSIPESATSRGSFAIASAMLSAATTTQPL